MQVIGLFMLTNGHRVSHSKKLNDTVRTEKPTNVALIHHLIYIHKITNHL